MRIFRDRVHPILWVLIGLNLSELDQLDPFPTLPFSLSNPIAPDSSEKVPRKQPAKKSGSNDTIMRSPGAGSLASLAEKKANRSDGCLPAFSLAVGSRQSQSGPLTRVRKNEGLKQQCTTSSGHRGCHNPICDKPLEPIQNGWRRTERLHCSDKCRQDASIIRRAAEKLIPLGKEDAWQILKSQLEAKKTDYQKRSRRNQAT